METFIARVLEVNEKNKMIELISNTKRMILRETLFWDVDPGKLDADKSKMLIIERVLSRGNMEEFKQLTEFYSTKTLIDTVIHIGYLDKKTMSFIASYLNFPIKDFLCYKKNQSNPAHCNF